MWNLCAVTVSMGFISTGLELFSPPKPGLVGAWNNTARCTLHAARCTLHAARCTLHAARCTLHAARCTLHAAHCTRHTAHGTLHTAHCTLHTAHCTLHTAHCRCLCLILLAEAMREDIITGASLVSLLYTSS